MAVAMSKTTAATTGKRAQMLIDGSWVDSTSGNEISVESPGNRQIIASIPRGGADDVGRAVQAASKAFASWSRVIPRERGRMLQKIADAVEARTPNRAEILLPFIPARRVASLAHRGILIQHPHRIRKSARCELR